MDRPGAVVSKPPNHRGSDFIPPYPAGTAPAGKLHDRPRMAFGLGLAATAWPCCPQSWASGRAPAMNCRGSFFRRPRSRAGGSSSRTSFIRSSSAALTRSLIRRAHACIASARGRRPCFPPPARSPRPAACAAERTACSSPCARKRRRSSADAVLSRRDVLQPA
jgi:hypothetical protein